MFRVVIERRCKPGKEKDLQKLLVQMRGMALTRHAHLSGEVYKNADDPSIWISIATWLTPEGWEAWKATPERREIVSKMESLLVEPEKVTVLEPVI
jgi:antibiotic biosynthesis monooxygenase (ABM) superfamily enzyme